MKAGLDGPSWIDDDPCYLGLGHTPQLRGERYGRFVRKFIPNGEWDLIREALQRGQLTGNLRFIDQVERITGRRIEHRRPSNQPREQHVKQICPL